MTRSSARGALAATLVTGMLTTGLVAVAPSAGAGQDRVQSADAAARRAPDKVRLDDKDALVARDEIADSDGSTHVRFDRVRSGVRVLGGDLVVHQRSNGDLVDVSATTRQALTLSLSPTTSRGEAMRTARAAAGNGATAVNDAELVVDARGPKPRLVWSVVVEGAQPDGTPSELGTLVDARDGSVLEQHEQVETVDGSGQGFFNGTVALATTPVSKGFSLKDPTRGNQYTVDMNNKQGGGGALFTDADNVWGSGTLSSRQSTAVDAQYGTAQTWDYYKLIHARSGIANNGAGAYNRVHYGRNYNNAFWSDSCFCMTYGDGDGTTYNPFDSLDVAGHEMSHGVTSRTANLTYSGESGGLNEATSDIFGAAVEFFTNNPNDAPDYKVGELLYKNQASGRALRYMYNPHLDGSSPNCWSSTLGGLDVHYSSGVANRFFFLVSEGSSTPAWGQQPPTCNGAPAVTGIGRTSAEQVWYRALTTYMTSATSYAGARAATLSAASDLFGGTASTQYAQVAAAWTAVGVG